jgi:hypothetical protein
VKYLKESLERKSFRLACGKDVHGQGIVAAGCARAGAWVSVASGLAQGAWELGAQPPESELEGTSTLSSACSASRILCLSICSLTCSQVSWYLLETVCIGHQKAVNAIAFDPTGYAIATCGQKPLTEYR